MLAEIEVEISKPNFQTFFKHTKLLSLTDSVVTISSPTQMIAEYIEKRYSSRIKKIIDKKIGQNVSIIFISQGLAPTIKQDSGPLFAHSLSIGPVARVRPTRIRQDYTFENLAVSESNQLAYTACLTVANSPGSKYNPLFIYGTVGVGKTHLMHAVANKVFDAQDNTKVLYVTTEEFTNEVVEAIRDKTTNQLRKKFRNVDLLLIDDIQFLSGKERVQEELFHTFNTLIDKGSQIIFSSDRPPHEIKKIEARLASRFEGGLTVDIDPPDFELRTAILLIKCKKYGLDLDFEMAKTIAERIVDARALEGFLLRLSSFTLDGHPITSQIIARALGRPREVSSVMHPDIIIDCVCDYYKVRQTQLKGAKRNAFLVKSRHVCMYLLKEEAHLTYAEIGNLLGGRDHTTVMHGFEKTQANLEADIRIKEDLAKIKEKIRDAQAR